MKVKKSEIIAIDMVDEDIVIQDNDGSLRDCPNNFCVRFHLKSNGHIVIPCFYNAGFDLEDMPESKEQQLRLTEKYLDSFSDDDDVELNAGILYNMDVYH